MKYEKYEQAAEDALEVVRLAMECGYDINVRVHDSYIEVTFGEYYIDETWRYSECVDADWESFP